MEYMMKKCKGSTHEINLITENGVYGLRSFTIEFKLGVIISIIIILVTISLFLENKENYSSIELQQNSITNVETPEFTGISLPQIIKNNDGILMVGSDIIPGTYRVELNDKSNIGYVVKYKSAALGTNDIIAKYTFEKAGYFIIKAGDVAVSLQGVKVTLQQNFYLFGF
jgi:hypothetical protein